MGQIVVSSGSYFFDLRDGYGKARLTGADLSSHIGAKITAKDTAGKEATAFVAAADIAAAYNSNIAPESCCTDPDDDQNNTTGWPTWASSTLSSVAGGHTGYALQILGNGSENPGTYIPDTPTPGQLFRIDFWVKQGTESTFRVRVYDNTNGGWAFDTGNTEATASWVHHTHYFTVPQACISMGVFFLQMASAGAGTTLLYDDVQVRQVSHLGLDAVTVESSAGSADETWLSIDSDFDANDIASVTILHYPEIVGNEKPDDGTTDQAISPDTTAMLLQIDVADDSGLDVDVDFYSMPGSVLLGSDTVTGGTGTASYLYTGLAVDSSYSWKATVDDGINPETSDTFTFSTRETAFTLHSYVAGSARVLPDDYYIYVLGADAHTIQDLYDRYAGPVDLVAATRGAILGIPEGVEHAETTSNNYGISLSGGGGASNASYFGIVLSENPASKSVVNLTHTYEPSGGEIATCVLANGYHKWCDVYLNVSSTFAYSGASNGYLCGFATGAGHNSKIIGCIIGDVSLPNMTATGAFLCFNPYSVNGFLSSLLCTVDASATVDVGSGSIVGFYFIALGVLTPHIYACTATGCDIGFATDAANPVMINCISQGNVTDVAEDGGGAFTQTTNAIDAGLSLDADGYTLLAVDTDGTDLSAYYTDDINGVEITDDYPRGCFFKAPDALSVRGFSPTFKPVWLPCNSPINSM